MSRNQSQPLATASRKPARRRKAKPSCADCYFGCRMLCALELSEPCSTFRPDSPAGLMPPAQPTLLVSSDVELEATGGLAAA